MDEKALEVIREFLAKTGGKITLESQNRVTITRPAAAAKATKDVDLPAIVGVEVSCYGNTAQAAAEEAIKSFDYACDAVDKFPVKSV